MLLFLLMPCVYDDIRTVCSSPIPREFATSIANLCLLAGHESLVYTKIGVIFPVVKAISTPIVQRCWHGYASKYLGTTLSIITATVPVKPGINSTFTPAAKVSSDASQMNTCHSAVPSNESPDEEKSVPSPYVRHSPSFPPL